MPPSDPTSATATLGAIGSAIVGVSAYLDHGATTPMDPAALDTMVTLLRTEYGNPSGAHGVSQSARRVLEEARDEIAELLGGVAREVVFTGGGTEAINLAISGSVASAVPGTVILTSAVEHDAVRNCAMAWRQRGLVHEEIRVDGSGVLDLVAFKVQLHALGDRVAVVGVMAVNNEVGTVQPVRELIELTRSLAPRAVVVVDAVQAANWLHLPSFTAGADFVAVSAHKFGGPKGTGALLVREGTPLAPIVFGGGQERERRSGTQNVAGAAAMATALRAAQANRVETSQRVGQLRDRLLDGILAVVPESFETGARAAKVANNAHVCFAGIESESLLVLLDDAGISASAGSACASGAVHVSHVLLAMGVPLERALGSLRLTLGVSTTEAEVDHAMAVIPLAVGRLRG